MLCSVAGTLVLAIFIDGSKQCPPWVETGVTHTELQGPGQVSPHFLPTPTMGRSRDDMGCTEQSSTCSTEIDDHLYLRRFSQGVSRGS